MPRRFFKITLTYLIVLFFFTGCRFKERLEKNEDNTATSSEMSIIRNDGTIEELKFHPPLELTNLGTNPLAFVLKDLNQDGRLDLTLLNTAVNEDRQFLRVLIRTSNDLSNTSDTWFQTAIAQKMETDFRPQHLIVEDVDKDGFQDIITTHPENDRIRFWKGQLADNRYFLATTATEITVGDFPTTIVAGAFETEGQVGAAITNRTSDDLSIILDFTTKTSLLLKESQGVGKDPVELVVGDWNKDGCLDLASLSHNKERVDIFKNTPCLANGVGISFEKLGDQKVGKNPQGMIVGDWDQDGLSDLAVTNKNDDDLSLLYGKGDGTFDRVDIRTGDGPGQLAFYDFNKDGVEDFVVSNLLDEDLSILLSNGDGKRPIKNVQTAYTHAHIIAGSVPSGNRPAFIQILDINHDEKIDIVLTLPYENKFSILLRN